MQPLAKDPQFLARYGKWAVVTGASSGIGLEIAKGLAQKGLSVALSGRNQERLRSVAAEIHAASQVETLVIPMDLANSGSALRIADVMSNLETGLLVNAAGFGSSGPFTNSDLSQAIEMVDVNCRALLEMTHLFGQRFAKQRRGGIILLSSIVAFQGAPWAANYAATKAYVQSLGEALGEELSSHGVDVLCSAPGPTETGFFARAGMKASSSERADVVARQTIEALGRRRLVVPGNFAKFLHLSLSTAPRFLRVKIMNGVMKSMSA
jgi:uncharacterized protein